jgi:preprotein translocase subunit SecA
MSDGQDITHPMVTKAITRAQKKVEAYNFEIRKNLLEYDEVMDVQRKEVYGLRQDVLDGNDARQRAVIEDMIRAVVDRHVDEAYRGDRDAPEERHDPAELVGWFRRHFAIDVDEAGAGPAAPEAKEALARAAVERWRRREEEIGTADMRRLERFLLLNSIDAKWKDHLRAMDGLRTGVGLRGYGQLDPKVEYKVEGHSMFSQMIWSIREEVTDLLFKVRLRTEDETHLADRWGGPEPGALGSTVTHSHSTALPGVPPPAADASHSAPAQEANRAYGDAREGKPVGSSPDAKAQPIKRVEPKVGRNDPCPCGSGRKYKKCHGEAA